MYDEEIYSAVTWRHCYRITCSHGCGHIIRVSFFKSGSVSSGVADDLIEIDDEVADSPRPQDCPLTPISPLAPCLPLSLHSPRTARAGHCAFRDYGLYVRRRGFAYIQITFVMDVPYANNYLVIIPFARIGGLRARDREIDSSHRALAAHRVGRPLHM